MPTWTPPGGSTVVLNSFEQVSLLDGTTAVRLHVDVTETDGQAALNDINTLSSTYLGGAVTISIASAAGQPQDNIK